MCALHAFVVDERPVGTFQIDDFERLVTSRNPAVQSRHQGGVDDEVGARGAADRLDRAGTQPERERAVWLRSLKNPHLAGHYFGRAANVFWSQLTTAVVTAGLMCAPPSVVYSSYSPVFAGTSR